MSYPKHPYETVLEDSDNEGIKKLVDSMLEPESKPNHGQIVNVKGKSLYYVTESHDRGGRVHLVGEISQQDYTGEMVMLEPERADLNNLREFLIQNGTLEESDIVSVDAPNYDLLDDLDRYDGRRYLTLA